MPKKILIVDDDALVIKTLSKCLSSLKYNVEIAQSGKQALAKARENNFDLIISDVRMPQIDGIETIRRIKEDNPQYSNIPVILITGYAGRGDIDKEAKELGIIECLYKPFDLGEFTRLVKAALKTPVEPATETPFKQEEVSLEFKALTREMAEYIAGIKEEFDRFDRENKNPEEQIAYIRQNRHRVFKELDRFFAAVWEKVKTLDKDGYFLYQKHFQSVILPLIEIPVEINRHIYQKPLGYAGDYIIINYIYDYYGDERYLGSSSYEKLINNYTCNIPVSFSNIERKRFLKNKILETLGASGKEKVRILSAACGPARELLELTQEGRINTYLNFMALDFEMLALDYIKSQISAMDKAKTGNLNIEYICRDITGIIRDKKLKEQVKSCDLIYAFGIFDYLSERMASRLTRELFELLCPGGELVICNISSENATHRAYYEFLGEWNMVHRTKEQMLSWVENLGGVKNIKFEEPTDFTSYLFLSVRKG